MLRLLELTIGLSVVVSLVALAGVPKAAQVAVGALCVAAGALAIVCRAVAPPPDGSRQQANGEPPRASGRWPQAPLLLPGALLAAWSAFQLVPLPGLGGPLTLSPSRTLVGVTWLVLLLLLNFSASTAFSRDGARRDFERLLTIVGFVASVQALAQAASWTWKIYWVFERYGDSIPFGSFWDRNHYATYMVMLAPVAVHGTQRRIEPVLRARDTRHWLLPFLRELNGPRGPALVVSFFASVSIMASIVASRSRGGIVALLVALALLTRGRRRALAAVLLVAALVGGMSQSGVWDLVVRFRREGDSGRIAVWLASLDALRGWRWFTGYGLDAYAEAAPEAVALWTKSGLRMDGLARYANNEYLQLMVECGVVGLGLVLWSLTSLLRNTARDAWPRAALAAAALHAVVDFSFHILAVGVLFSVIAGFGAARGQGGGGETRPR